MDSGFKKKEVLLLICIFCFSFCSSILITSPALFLNDEWISANQLYQLYTGDQLLENEGKYGKLFTGEMTSYFTTRNNSLGYSLFLPVISYIPMWLFVHLGDFSRFFVILIWFLLLISGLLCLDSLFPERVKHQKMYLLLIFICLFVFFLLNMINYIPFQMRLADRPVEIASIIFTQEILFSFMGIILYKLYRQIFENISYCLAGMIISLSCSSYLFWASAAKDHMLVAFLFLCVIYCFIGYLKTRSIPFGFGLFFMMGLLIWARPEFGSIIGIVCGIYWVILLYRRYLSSGIGEIKKGTIMLAGLIPGLLPFICNNWFITKNPFIPPQYLYLLSSRNITPDSLGTTNAPLYVQSAHHSFLETFISQIFAFYRPDIQNVFVDVLTLLVITNKGAIGLLLICPIIIPAFFLFCLDIIRKDLDYIKKHSSTLLLVSVFGCGVILAYLRGFHGMGSSLGIMPDVRYLSPLYIPMSIISVIVIGKRWEQSGKKFLKILLGIVVSIPILIILGMLIIQPFGGGYLGFVYGIATLTAGFVVITSITSLISSVKDRFDTFAMVVFGLLVALPLTWQVMITFLFAYLKMNGYLFWLPVVEKLYTSYIMVIE